MGRSSVALKVARIGAASTLAAALIGAAVTVASKWHSAEGPSVAIQQTVGSVDHSVIVGRDVAGSIVINSSPTRPARRRVKKGTEQMLPLRWDTYPLGPVAYAPGTIVAHIPWTNTFTDTRLEISNPGGVAALDIDLVVHLDQPIAAVGQVSDISGFGAHAMPRQREAGKLSAPTLLFISPVNERGEIESPPGLEHDRVVDVSDRYRLTCPRLNAGDSLRLVVAGVGGRPQDASLREPRLIRLRGTFSVARAGLDVAEYKVSVRRRFPSLPGRGKTN